MNHDKLSIKSVEYWILDEHGRKQYPFNTLASAKLELISVNTLFTEHYHSELLVEIQLDNGDTVSYSTR